MLLSLDVPPAQNGFQICITLNVTHNDNVKIGDGNGVFIQYSTSIFKDFSRDYSMEHHNTPGVMQPHHGTPMSSPKQPM